MGLDDYHRRFILRLLDGIAEQSQTNIIYVTHVADEQPNCINQMLSFREIDSGGFTIDQSEC